MSGYKRGSINEMGKTQSSINDREVKVGVGIAATSTTSKRSAA